MGIFGHGISLHEGHPHVCRIAAIQWGRGICGLTHGGLVIISTRVVICRGVPTLMVREIGLRILSLILGVILGLPRGGARILWKKTGPGLGHNRGCYFWAKTEDGQLDTQTLVIQMEHNPVVVQKDYFGRKIGHGPAHVD